MNSFILFDNLYFFNTCISFLALYILAVAYFGIFYSFSSIFAYPNLLLCFSLFSFFNLVCILWLFCVDFYVDDSLFLFNQNIELIFLILAIFVCFSSYDFLKARKILKFEYDILFLKIVLGGFCLCFADSFLLMYLIIELQSLASYVLSSFKRDSEFAAEAGLKYFVFGAVISCFFLLGFSCVYLTYGLLSFELLFSILFECFDFRSTLGIFFILVGLLFKLGAAPFHLWICDVYDGSLLSVFFIFASLSKIVMFSFLLKIFFFLFNDYQEFLEIFFLVTSLLSLIVGSFSAFYQKRLKRLFAFSAISHTGFILLGFLALNPGSAKAIIFYLEVYGFLTILSFSLLIFAVGFSWFFPKYLINWLSIGTSNPLFTFAFILSLFSTAGIPPLAGFFSKFFILFSLFSSQYVFTSLLVIILSSIGCFYYIRFIKLLLSSKNSNKEFWFTDSSRRNSEIVVSFFLIANIFLCFFLDLFSFSSVAIGLTLF